MVNYKQGNLIDDLHSGAVVIQQVNCQGKMGAGFAGALRYYNPDIYENYLSYISDIPKEKLFGKCNVQNHKDYKVINIFSQYYLGACNDMIFKLNQYDINDDFDNRLFALMRVLEICKIHGTIKEDDRILIPLIASGLAADKKLKSNMIDLEYFQKYIAPVFNEILEEYDITCYYL